MAIAALRGGAIPERLSGLGIAALRERQALRERKQEKRNNDFFHGSFPPWVPI
jgi:hypothetical protein